MVIDAETPAKLISSYLCRDYAAVKGLAKWLIRLRPYICPFGLINSHIPSNTSLLDVGCGVGIVTSLAVQSGKIREAVGFDTSSKAIAIANLAETARANLGVTFQTIKQDEWPIGQFETVACIDVLHHVPVLAQHAFIEKVVASIAPGGKVIFKDIAPTPWWKAAANRLHDLIMARQWVNYRSAEQVADWFTQQGLQVTLNKRCDMLWYSHNMVCAIRH